MKFYVSENYVYWFDVVNLIPLNCEHDYVGFVSFLSYYDSFNFNMSFLFGIQNIDDSWEGRFFKYERPKLWFIHEVNSVRGMKVLRSALSRRWFCFGSKYYFRGKDFHFIYGLRGSFYFYNACYALNDVFNMYGNIYLVKDHVFFTKSFWWFRTISAQGWGRVYCSNLIFHNNIVYDYLGYPTFNHTKIWTKWSRNFMFTSEFMHTHFWTILHYFFFYGYLQGYINEGDFIKDIDSFTLFNIFNIHKFVIFKKTSYLIHTSFFYWFIYIFIDIFEIVSNYFFIILKYFFYYLLWYDIMFIFFFFFSSYHLYFFFRFYNYIITYYESFSILFGFLRNYKWVYTNPRERKLQRYFNLNIKNHLKNKENIDTFRVYKDDKYFLKIIDYKIFNYFFILFLEIIYRKKSSLFVFFESLLSRISFFFRSEFIHMFFLMKNFRVIFFFFHFFLLIMFFFLPLFLFYSLFIFIFYYCSTYFSNFLRDHILNVISIYSYAYFFDKFQNYRFDSSFNILKMFDKLFFFFYFYYFNYFSLYKERILRDFKDDLYDKLFDDFIYQKTLYLPQPEEFIIIPYTGKFFYLDFDEIFSGMRQNYFFFEFLNKFFGIFDYSKGLVDGIHSIWNDYFLVSFICIRNYKFAKNFYLWWNMYQVRDKIIMILDYLNKLFNCLSSFFFYYIYYLIYFSVYLLTIFINFIILFFETFSNRVILFYRLYFCYTVFKRLIFTYKLVYIIYNFFFFIMKYFKNILLFLLNNLIFLKERFIIILKILNKEIDLVFFNKKVQIFVLPISKFFVLLYFYIVKYNIIWKFVCIIFWRIWLSFIFFLFIFLFFDFNFFYNIISYFILYVKMDPKLIFYYDFFSSIFLNIKNINIFDKLSKFFFIQYLLNYYSGELYFLRRFNIDLVFCRYIMHEYKLYLLNKNIIYPFDINLNYILHPLGYEYKWLLFQRRLIRRQIPELAQMFRMFWYYGYYPHIMEKILFFKKGFFLFLFNYFYFFFEWFFHYGFYLFVYDIEILFKYWNLDFFSSWIYTNFFLIYNFFFIYLVFLVKCNLIDFYNYMYEWYEYFYVNMLINIDMSLFRRFRVYRLYFCCDLLLFFQHYLYYMYLYVIYNILFIFKFIIKILLFIVNLSPFHFKENIISFESLKIFYFFKAFLFDFLSMSEKFVSYFVPFDSKIMKHYVGGSFSNTMTREFAIPQITMEVSGRPFATFETNRFFLSIIGSKENYNYYFLSQFRLHKFSYRNFMQFYVLGLFYAFIILIFIIMMLTFFFRSFNYGIKNKFSLFRSSSYFWNRTSPESYDKLSDYELEWIYSFDFMWWFTRYIKDLFLGDVFLEELELERDLERKFRKLSKVNEDYEHRKADWKERFEKEKQEEEQIRSDLNRVDWPYYFAYKNVMRMYWDYNKKNAKKAKFRGKAFAYLKFMNGIYYKKRYEVLRKVIENMLMLNFTSNFDKNFVERYQFLIDETISEDLEECDYEILKNLDEDAIRSQLLNLKNDFFGFIIDKTDKEKREKTKAMKAYWYYYVVFNFLYENVDDPHFIKQYSKNFWFWPYMRKFKTLVEKHDEHGIDFVEFPFTEPDFYNNFGECVDEYGYFGGDKDKDYKISWFNILYRNYWTKWHYFAEFKTPYLSSKNSKEAYYSLYRYEDFLWWLSKVDADLFKNHINFTFFHAHEWPTLLHTHIKLEELYYLFDAKNFQTTEDMKYVPWFKPGVLRGDLDTDWDVQQKVNAYWRRAMVQIGSATKLGYFVNPLAIIPPQVFSFYMPFFLLYTVQYSVIFNEVGGYNLFDPIYSLFHFFIVEMFNLYEYLRFDTSDISLYPMILIDAISMTPFYTGTEVDFLNALFANLPRELEVIQGVCGYPYQHGLFVNDWLIDLEKWTDILHKHSLFGDKGVWYRTLYGINKYASTYELWLNTINYDMSMWPRSDRERWESLKHRLWHLDFNFGFFARFDIYYIKSRILDNINKKIEYFSYFKDLGIIKFLNQLYNEYSIWYVWYLNHVDDKNFVKITPNPLYYDRNTLAFVIKQILYIILYIYITFLDSIWKFVYAIILYFLFLFIFYYVNNFKILFLKENMFDWMSIEQKDKKKWFV